MMEVEMDDHSGYENLYDRTVTIIAMGINQKRLQVAMEHWR